MASPILPLNNVISSTGKGLSNGRIILDNSDLGGYITVTVPKREDQEPIALLVYRGKYDTYLSADISLDPNGKNYIVRIPVSEIMRTADPGRVQMVKIRGHRDYCFWVETRITDESSQIPSITASDYYQGLFTQVAQNNPPQINALMVVVPNKDPSPLNPVNPNDDQYYTGAHGALTVLKAKNSGWKLVSEKITPNDPCYSIHIFERRIYPPKFTGPMLEEFEKLPPQLKQKINQEGILCRLTVTYYPHTENGYESMVKELTSGNYQVVTLQGHRLNPIRERLQTWPKNHLKFPVAYFGNHCTSLASDNFPLQYITNGKIFIPIGTTDSLNPGAELNLAFLEMILTGKVDPQIMKKTLAQIYNKKIDSSPNSNAIFGSEQPEINPYADPDKDSLPNYYDPEPDKPNLYTFDSNNQELIIALPNGTIRIPYLPKENNDSILANALSPEEFEQAQAGPSKVLKNLIESLFPLFSKNN